MYKIYTFLLFFLIANIFAQEKIITRSANVTFEASVPSFEEVKAVNKNVTIIFKTKTGEIAALALMKGFRFKNALMEEHFNENYIESNKYPKATFKGKINDFDLKELNSNYKEFVLRGQIDLRGNSKYFYTKAYLRKRGDKIDLKTDFIVTVDDFDIKIPSIVNNKISKLVNITIESTLD